MRQGEDDFSYNLRSLCDFSLPPLLPCSFGKREGRKGKKKPTQKKGKGCNVSQGTDWQTSASCLIYLFLSLKKGKGTEPTLHSRAPIPLTNQMVAVGRVLTAC